MSTQNDLADAAGILRAHGHIALSERLLALAEQPAPAQPLTDEQCDAIYNALDEWSREVDAYDFGLPAVAGGGIEKGREIIKTAHGITKGTP